MFLVFYIFRLLLLPHGVKIFGTNLHRFEKFGLWRRRHLPHRLWKKGTYQKSFLGGKLCAFCWLHLKLFYLCCLGFGLSNVHTLFLYFFFFKKSCLDLKSGVVMAQWREKVTWPKKAGKLGVSLRIIWHYGGSRMKAKVWDWHQWILAKQQLLDFLGCMKTVCTLKSWKTASAKMYGRYRTASFYCQWEQKVHMWLPFLLKIKIYKRMMMMIFTEHLVLRTYVFLCLGFIFFFNVSFRYFIRRKYLKARFDR